MPRASTPLIVLAAILLAIPAPALAQGAPAAQRPAPPDWAALQREAVQLLSDYLQVNTTNPASATTPAGNEVRGLEFLRGVLERNGISAQILDTAEMGGGRGNLYARLEGNDSKKAIALVNHVDVVPADARYWTEAPLSGAVRDGYVYGRGALDMKGEGIAQLVALLAIKRSGVPLTRDIVFIANSDEELGSTGAITFAQRHPDLLSDVEFLITEGGDNSVENGKLTYYGVGVAEKRTFWQRITVKGVPSHGSRPTPQNPVPKLVAALDRIARYETPLRVTPGVEKYFRDIAPTYQGEQRQWLSNVRAALANPRARQWILSDIYWNAILRNTISLTVLQGSNKTNVIPAEATADLDIRLLPDQNADSMRAELQRVAADTAVQWQTLLAAKTPLENPVDTDLFRAMERAARERDPNAIVTTPMLTGATDRPTYRALGIITYGVDPFKVERRDAQTGVHGNNERLSVENVGFGVRFLYDILRYVQ